MYHLAVSYLFIFVEKHLIITRISRILLACKNSLLLGSGSSDRIPKLSPPPVFLWCLYIRSIFIIKMHHIFLKPSFSTHRCLSKIPPFTGESIIKDRNCRQVALASRVPPQPVHLFPSNRPCARNWFSLASSTVLGVGWRERGRQNNAKREGVV